MLLETRALSRSFGVVRALHEVGFTLRAGEVHGLMGENGAGKSTLIKTLTGLVRPDSGEILLDGRPVRFDGPRAAQAAGVAAVYQEINLVPERTIADNLFLGREPTRLGLVDRRRMLRDAEALLRRYGIAAEPGRILRTLGLGVQQLVSIARVVSLGARVVILDEPSSALSAAEVERLMALVDRLRSDGIGVIYVSHRLSECYRLCDRLTVLRDGAVVETATTEAMPRGRLIAAMLGRDPAAVPVRAPAPDGAAPAAEQDRSGDPPPALRVERLRWRQRVRDVSLSVRRGEVLGLVGLLGSGRTETMRTIFGAELPEAGHVAVDGRRIDRPGPAASLRRGLAFLSEDRRTDGIFPELSVRENLSACVLPSIARWGIVSRRRQDALVDRFLAELGVRSAGPGTPVALLSGGNQQKVLIARALCASPRAVMLDDPTRGIDVGAKAEVHRVVRGLAADGLGVLMSSSEIEEVLEVADRMAVLDEGAVVAIVPTAGRTGEDVLALLAAGERSA